MASATKKRKGYCTACNSWITWIKHASIGAVECPECGGVAVVAYLKTWMRGS
ncbi:hypothetical protein LCGC14_0442650 [marine sediment metagenome]|uniref:Transcription factor zinc-finger domain-containing protein n=1 Tax=marine sediment metagenome TaxID=412755 RepID=A0A0F9SJZ7_9ZZZZ